MASIADIIKSVASAIASAGSSSGTSNPTSSYKSGSSYDDGRETLYTWNDGTTTKSKATNYLDAAKEAGKENIGLRNAVTYNTLYDDYNSATGRLNDLSDRYGLDRNTGSIIPAQQNNETAMAAYQKALQELNRQNYINEMTNNSLISGASSAYINSLDSGINNTNYGLSKVNEASQANDARNAYSTGMLNNLNSAQLASQYGQRGSTVTDEIRKTAEREAARNRR
jgi:hypothetical protein